MMNANAVPWSGRPVAVVHDWFQGYHGSERVVEVLADHVFAEASRVDVLTFHAARELLPADLDARIVRESRLARLPGVRQVGHDPGRWRYLLPWMPHYFRSLDLSEYELVVASSHACALRARPPERVPYVCYCHTPMRYAWLTETDRGRASGLRGSALRLSSGWLRRGDRDAARRPDRLVANSTAVRDRIRRFYGRRADVVHPPVELDDEQRARGGARGHFLWVGRLVPYKRPELVAEAFRDLPHKLVMVGIGPREAALRNHLPDNVELRAWIPREELARLYRESLGFVHVGEEDFGISMVEALAAGSPVLAVRRGGARDIVRDGVDGLLLDAAAPDAIRTGVDTIGGREWDRVGLSARAQRFSRDRFVAEMRRELGRLGAN
jgi:glycosyltransferase involved in cell wall biosynthesis